MENSINSQKTIIVKSFGFKIMKQTQANCLFDVRFLDNPYWQENLRHLTGLDQECQKFVLEQSLAQTLICDLISMLKKFLPVYLAKHSEPYTIAIGCTGGQHRSVAIVEAIVAKLVEDFPNCKIISQHLVLNHEKIYNPMTLKGS